QCAECPRMTDIAVAGQQNVAGQLAPADAAALAARHGLRVAGERPRLPEYVAQVWRYRNFIGAYANGRMVAQFATARLGRVWQVLTPMFNAGVYYLIFGVILNTRHTVEASGVSFIAYLCTGVFIFSFTQTVLQTCTSSISSNLGIIRALHFPRASLPVAMALM